ncbi:cathelicidin-6-like [Ornithorhynchus anatinus]|uniref:cathelicidin-6-like n=1 Tax=Ornithorhynchus anatinus TaxID=9258 RepID=UPI0010A8D814|nr:cathelicidin-6-like [Ornithorhynchus anatinus]
MAEGSWRVLLLVSLAAALATARGLSQRRAVKIALDSYNKGSDTDSTFRLVHYIKKSGPVDPSKPIPVTFTVQETVCRKSDNPVPDRCDFKKKGLVKICTGTVSSATGSPSASITCDGSVRTKRFFRTFGRMIGRIRRGIGRTWRKIKRGYREGRRGKERGPDRGSSPNPGGSPDQEENSEPQQ